jgi:hypothetical protein
VSYHRSVRFLLVASALLAGTGLAQEAIAPKVAVVLRGDPDPAAVAAAQRVAAAAEEAGLQLPADPALRSALRGEGEGDGLDAARRLRRSLGLDPEADAETLTRLGAVTGADCLAVVEGGDAVRVWDVGAAAFYEGSRAVDAPGLGRYLARRAELSARGAAEVAAAPAPVPSPGEAAEEAVAEAIAEDAEEESPELWRQIWPYAAAALLLGGMVTLIVVTSTNGNGASPTPTLTFIPGGDP